MRRKIPDYLRYMFLLYVCLAAGLWHNNTAMLSRCFVLGDGLEQHREEGRERDVSGILINFAYGCRACHAAFIGGATIVSETQTGAANKEWEISRSQRRRRHPANSNIRMRNQTVRTAFSCRCEAKVLAPPFCVVFITHAHWGMTSVFVPFWKWSQHFDLLSTWPGWSRYQ